MTILIKGGRILDPATKTDDVMDLFIEDGVITKRGKNIKKKAEKTIDAKGLYVMPGLVDMHVHLRDPGFTHKGDVETETRSAARGGYTTVLAMPNTKPVVDNADVVRYVHHKAESVGLVHVLQVGAVTKGQQGEELADIKEMVEAGSPAISEDGKSVMNSLLARDAMLVARDCNIPVLSHCEDKNLVGSGVVNEDENAKRWGLAGITNSVEDIIVARDIMLSHDTGAKLHLCHCSTEDSVMMVDLAKQKNVKVTAEVCPHHFTLTSDDIRKIAPEMDVEKNVIAADADADTNFKMNPPLRTKKDVEALRVGLRDNIMDVISTDHAPHTFADKNTSMKNAPFGIVGLETAACLTYTELVLGGYLTPMQMAEKMSYNPAKIVGLDKGDIAPGKTADIVIFDPNETYKIDKNKFASKGRNTPFDGRTVTGKVKMTIVGGHIVYEE